MLTILIIGASFIGVACLVGGMATLLTRGGGGTAVEERLDVLTGIGGPSAKGNANEPQLLQSPLNDVPNFMEDFVKRFFNLRAFLQQADTQLTPAKFIGLSLGIAGTTVVLLPIIRVPIAAAPLGIVMGLIPLAALYMKRKRRLAAFGKQLPEALELIGRALRAGHSLASGFKLVADEMPPPIGTEFERSYEAQNLGVPLEEAIEVNNRSQYGLSTSIFTQDVNRAFTAMRDIFSGLVYINHGTTGAEIQFPFGGIRGTGNGHREAGQAALDVFTEWKSIYVDYSGKLQRAQIDNRDE